VRGREVREREIGNGVRTMDGGGGVGNDQVLGKN